MCLCIHIYIYMFICMFVCMYVCIQCVYILLYIERDRDRDTHKERERSREISCCFRHMHVYMCVCMYVRTYVCKHTYCTCWLLTVADRLLLLILCCLSKVHERLNISWVRGTHVVALSRKGKAIRDGKMDT